MQSGEVVIRLDQFLCQLASSVELVFREPPNVPQCDFASGWGYMRLMNRSAMTSNDYMRVSPASRRLSIAGLGPRGAALLRWSLKLDACHRGRNHTSLPV